MIKKIWRQLKARFRKERPLSQQQLKKMRVGEFDIYANETHLLATYIQKFPSYSQNMHRIASVIAKFSNHEGAIIDIGANIGDSVALIRSAGVKNPIHCVEGEQTYFGILKKNQPFFDNVFLHQTFLGEQTEALKGTLASEGGTAGFGTSGNETIDTITLDDFVKNNNINDLRLLKIDTDGYDLKIIRGGLTSIAQQKPVIFLEYDPYFLTKNQDDGVSTLQTLAEIGYEKTLFYDNYGRLIVAIDLSNQLMVKQLHNYVDNRQGAFAYYDICFFHKDDAKMADDFIESEMKIK